MRVVFWNIRHGGGVRAAALARQIRAWAADAVALCEFRGTPPSGELARALAGLGLAYQCTTADVERPALNGLLLAARIVETEAYLGANDLASHARRGLRSERSPRRAWLARSFAPR